MNHHKKVSLVEKYAFQKYGETAQKYQLAYIQLASNLYFLSVHLTMSQE